MGFVFDTCFLVDLVHGDEGAVAKAAEIEEKQGDRYLCAPVLYEILTGLYYGRSKTEMSRMRRIASRFMLLPFDEMAARMAAEVQTEAKRLGKTASDVDAMVAGIAMHHGHVVVTRDKGILLLDIGPALEVETY